MHFAPRLLYTILMQITSCLFFLLNIAQLPSDNVLMRITSFLLSFCCISHSYRLIMGREAFARVTSTAREMKDCCARLFKSLSLGPERLQFGITKLFLRAGVVSLFCVFCCFVFFLRFCLSHGKVSASLINLFSSGDLLFADIFVCDMCRLRNWKH